MRQLYFHQKRIKRYVKKLSPSIISYERPNKRVSSKTSPVVANTPAKVQLVFQAHFSSLLEANNNLTLDDFVSSHISHNTPSLKYSEELHKTRSNKCMFAATLALVKTQRAPGIDELMYETIKSLPCEVLQASFGQLISLSLAGSHPVHWSIDRLVNMFKW